MGTSYLVRAIGLEGIEPAALQEELDARLEEINAAMSTWRDDSEISAFNEAFSTDWVEVSADFHAVVRTALAVSEATDGGFDVTIEPLIRLWGFSDRGEASEPPPPEDIEKAMAQIGWHKLKVDDASPRIRKTDPELTINLSAIAKGYGVDAIADVIEHHGGERYLVEIVGEIRVNGLNVDDEPWQIGVERPDVGGRVVQEVIPLTLGGVATSGDYRNYFEKDGVRYSHIIDPRQGAPIQHRVAAVTVIGETAMIADAWATALLVEGFDRGFSLAQENDIGALFLVRDESSDGFAEVMTPLFSVAVEQNDPFMPAEGEGAKKSDGGGGH
ncbi:MAG: FAD:protein FMN transferase [Geminicoccaceae bacterium]